MAIRCRHGSYGNIDSPHDRRRNRNARNVPMLVCLHYDANCDHHWDDYHNAGNDHHWGNDVHSGSNEHRAATADHWNDHEHEPDDEYYSQVRRGTSCECAHFSPVGYAIPCFSFVIRLIMLLLKIAQRVIMKLIEVIILDLLRKCKTPNSKNSESLFFVLLVGTLALALCLEVFVS